MVMGDLRLAHAVRHQLVRAVPAEARNKLFRKRRSALVPARQEVRTCAECPTPA